MAIKPGMLLTKADADRLATVRTSPKGPHQRRRYGYLLRITNATGISKYIMPICMDPTVAMAPGDASIP